MDIDTKEYYPPHIQEMKEFGEISKAYDAELRRLWDVAGKIERNSTLLTLDEDGVKMHENFLGVVPGDGDSLETRRARIVMIYVQSIPFTEKKLREVLNGLLGNNAYDLNIEGYDMTIVSHIISFYLVEDLLKETLTEMLPANIAYIIKNEVKGEISGGVTLAGGVTESRTMTVKIGTYLKIAYAYQMPIRTGGAVSEIVKNVSI